jgi:hypothetical protein
MTQTKQDKTIEQYKRALGIAMAALEMYADPSSYHAIAFMFDAPCGHFANDFSRTKQGGYNRPMPGKTARWAMRELARKYGGLHFYSKNIVSG